MTGATVRQATGVAIGGRAILIEGPPGSGKTTLALTLIDRSATLIGDDAVSLTCAGERVTVAPPPTIAGLIEVRNVGLLSMATTTAPLALVLRLAPDAPRFVEQAGTVHVLGQPIPLLWFDPTIAAAAIRAELALVHHGLAFDLHSPGKPANT